MALRVKTQESELASRRCVLEKAQVLAVKWECEELVAAAVKTRSIIYDEQLGDSEKALETLRAFDLRGRSMILKDQEANILFRRGNFEAALLLWRKVLSGGAEEPDASL